jgi:branched-chain amino acid transport system substrate-binding protein
MMGNARRSWVWGLAALSLVAAGCGSDDGSSEPSVAEPTPATDGAVVTEAPVATDAPDATDAPATTEASDVSEDEFTARVAEMGPATGEPMRVGLVNTEGVPGLDFPDIRENMAATFAYLNEHGGLGGRPVELSTCAAKGSPETSQACAQEIIGTDVELALLGLDLFPGYPTFDAGQVPVIGLLPILPGDYTANALFTTGGNATLAAGMAGVAKEKFDAKSVGIISADNPGANGGEAALKASLDKVGIPYVSIKGGSEETDAGYQGLMQQANASNPDLLISLYDAAGCIGTMRGRVALGIETPVLAASACAATEVIDQVGDDALGWTFLGAQTNEETPANDLIREIMGPVLGVPADQVDPASLGLGGLGILQAMTLAKFADAVAASGGEVTGKSIYDYFGSTKESIWPSGLGVECGKAPAYPSICTFEFPVIEYTEDGTLQPAKGIEVVSAFDYLP